MKKLIMAMAILGLIAWGCGDGNDDGNANGDIYNPVGLYSISYEITGLNDCPDLLFDELDSTWTIDNDWQIEDDGDICDTDMKCDSDKCEFEFEFSYSELEIDILFMVIIIGAGEINSSGEVEGDLFVKITSEPLQPGLPCNNIYSISGNKK